VAAIVGLTPCTETGDVAIPARPLVLAAGAALLLVGGPMGAMSLAGPLRQPKVE
jgi:hypothetical protein